MQCMQNIRNITQDIIASAMISTRLSVFTLSKSTIFFLLLLLLRLFHYPRIAMRIECESIECVLNIQRSFMIVFWHSPYANENMLKRTTHSLIMCVCGTQSKVIRNAYALLSPYKSTAERMFVSVAMTAIK